MKCDTGCKWYPIDAGDSKFEITIDKHGVKHTNLRLYCIEDDSEIQCQKECEKYTLRTKFLDKTDTNMV
ncbi:MAG: hypothetical protein WC389_22390 [Lutibacter sp.]|jgi:hypothetical protein